MAEHNEFGKSGEDFAVEYLQEKGYAILNRNWRSGHKEIDIVAQWEDYMVFVEVKTRRNRTYGRPSDSVTEPKMRRLALAADAYVRCYRIDMPVRFDILTVEGVFPHVSVQHIEDAFRSPVWYK